MKYVFFNTGLVILLLFSGGCSYIIDQEKKANELVVKRMDTINWNEVDSYPLFESCNELAPKLEQENCFKDTFVNHLVDTLNQYDFTIKKPVLDTIFLDLKIDNKGNISVLTINANNEAKKELPELRSAVEESINSLPKIYAAQKKAISKSKVQLIPVTTKFTLPIILNVK